MRKACGNVSKTLGPNEGENLRALGCKLLDKFPMAFRFDPNFHFVFEVENLDPSATIRVVRMPLFIWGVFGPYVFNPCTLARATGSHKKHIALASACLCIRCSVRNIGLESGNDFGDGRTARKPHDVELSCIHNST